MNKDFFYQQLEKDVEALKIPIVARVLDHTNKEIEELEHKNNLLEKRLFELRVVLTPSCAVNIANICLLLISVERHL